MRAEASGSASREPPTQLPGTWTAAAWHARQDCAPRGPHPCAPVPPCLRPAVESAVVAGPLHTPARFAAAASPSHCSGPLRTSSTWALTLDWPGARRSPIGSHASHAQPLSTRYLRKPCARPRHVVCGAKACAGEAVHATRPRRGTRRPPRSEARQPYWAGASRVEVGWAVRAAGPRFCGAPARVRCRVYPSRPPSRHSRQTGPLARMPVRAWARQPLAPGKVPLSAPFSSPQGCHQRPARACGAGRAFARAQNV